VTVLLLSGNANPDGRPCALITKAGMVQLNGGFVSRMDPNYPSVAHLVAPHQEVDGAIQNLDPVGSDYMISEMGNRTGDLLHQRVEDLRVHLSRPAGLNR